ncbi:MAG: HDOD domain-containing protein, partial [Methylococcales bacterium]|nr:HDOD domain-containing protein [Methylococcales bacterium]
KYCAEISKLTEGVETDEAYMLGLFHDAGSLLLARKFVDEYTGVLFTLNEKPLSVPLKEKKFFDVNHCSIGYILAKKWKLDEVLCQAIYLHHIPSIKKLKNKKLKKMIAMVKLANLLAKGYNPDQMSFEDAQYEHDALQELKLNNIQLKTLRMKNMSTG